MAATPAHASVWKKSFQEAQAEADKNDQLMLVEMYASWCGWCKKMAQEVFPSESFQRATADMILLQLNTEDGKEGTRISSELQVRSLPTLFLLTSDMMIVGMIAGYAPAPEFTAQLLEEKSKWREFESRMDSAAKGRLSDEETLELSREIAARRGFARAQRHSGGSRHGYDSWLRR